LRNNHVGINPVIHRVNTLQLAYRPKSTAKEIITI
jgi:hypothetical protein